MSWGMRILDKLNRKKVLDDDVMETPLRRCLTTFDLTLLGIGHMIGAGIFVLTGTVVKDVAGPGTVLSYFFAGIAATLSSLCYAEFGARVPKAGSAYTYTYVCIGEFWAFIIGWNIILEHILGAASVARAWSGTFDSLFRGAIKNGTLAHVGHMSIPGLSEYPDFIAMVTVLLVVAFVAYGAKLSANVNSFFTVINGLVILLIISVGFSLGESKNWSDQGHGGFLPYGFPGVFAGAATCFYAFIGFEGIAVAGEEAKNPEKSIPLATGFAMAIVTLLYVGTSAALTLMVPYYEVDTAAPFPSAFEMRGFHWARLVIAIGALFGITTSLIGSLFSLPRAVYAMSTDGLFFEMFGSVHTRTQTPLMSIIVFGSISSILAFLVDIETLVEFLSIGTLLSFTLVAASIMILRYQTAEQCQFKLRPEDDGRELVEDEASDKKNMIKASQSHDDIGKLKKGYSALPVIKNLPHGFATVAAVVVMALFMVAFHLVLLQGFWAVKTAQWWAILMLVVFGTGMICCFLVLCAHEQNECFITFQVPFVPLLPTLSMFINIAMMLKLNYLTWIRLAVWLSIGFVIYFAYGIRRSKENRPLAAYSQVVNYAGTDINGEGMAGKLDETVQRQQPRSEIQMAGDQ